MAEGAKTKELFVSVVMVLDAKTKHAADHVKNTASILTREYSNYEVVIIDNDVPVAKMAAVIDLLEDTPCIRIVKLSRLEPKDVCVYAGLEAAIGDVVVVLVGGQDPPELLTDLVERTNKTDMVFGVSETRTRRGIVNHYGALLFYWYNKRFLRIDIPENSTYFMAFNRKTINALTRSNRFARHIRYQARQIGYSSQLFPYIPLPHRSEKRSLFSLLSWLGFGAAVLNLLYALYVVAVVAFKNDVAEGWTTLSMQSSFMFFMLFLIMTILVEYVARILDESRGDSPYHIVDELNSRISVADATRRNITS
jgi:polyisoprenyl-phosphate glycosyltransferase